MRLRTFTALLFVGLATNTACPCGKLHSMMPSVSIALAANTAPDADGVQKVRWEELRGLDYKAGTVTPQTKALDGKTVKVAGFVVPLDDSPGEGLAEFVLVPQPMVCIHVPPPPPNQLIHVIMKTPYPTEKLSDKLGEPMWVTGKLTISQLKSDYGDTSYEMQGLNLEPYKEK